jgi:hypothetical protein
VFRVDALYPASNDLALQDFIKQFPYLSWPLFHEELFSGQQPTLLDIYHPARHLYEKHLRNVASPTLSFHLFQWHPADALGDVWLATFGGFPPEEEIGRDYEKLMEKLLAATKSDFDREGVLPGDAFMSLTSSSLTKCGLVPDRPSGHSWSQTGFYVGDAQDFTDLVSFWNLRAADIDLFFYDPSCAKRLDPAREALLARLSKPDHNPEQLEDRIPLWSKSRESNVDASLFGSHIIRCTSTPAIWNGLNVKPPFMAFETKSVLADLAETEPGPRVSFQLPQKPFFDDIESLRVHSPKLASF